MVNTRSALNAGLPPRNARRTQSAMATPPRRAEEAAKEVVDESHHTGDQSLNNGVARENSRVDGEENGQDLPRAGSEASYPPQVEVSRQTQGRNGRQGRGTSSDRTYNPSRQSRGSMSSDQLRVMQDMVYEAVHNAMAGLMPPPPDRAPPQAAEPAS